jgi:hypothetical protein
MKLGFSQIERLLDPGHRRFGAHPDTTAPTSPHDDDRSHSVTPL